VKLKARKRGVSSSPKRLADAAATRQIRLTTLAKKLWSDRLSLTSVKAEDAAIARPQRWLLPRRKKSAKLPLRHSQKRCGCCCRRFQSAEAAKKRAVGEIGDPVADAASTRR